MRWTFARRLRGKGLGWRQNTNTQQGGVTLRSKSNQARAQPRSDQDTKSKNIEHETKLSNGEGVLAEATMFELIWYDTTKMYLGFIANALL